LAATAQADDAYRSIEMVRCNRWTPRYIADGYALRFLREPCNPPEHVAESSVTEKKSSRTPDLERMKS